MLDRERILGKLDELDGYLRELHQIAPPTLEEYRRSIEKRRACERLLQIATESVIDICHLWVAGLRLGLPSEEDDLFEKLAEAGMISEALRKRLREMKGFRNLLVHEYGRVDDRIVFEILTNRLGDFAEFRKIVIQALRS
jgi:uncharacterized protein YutE (UPF0331/DUF86 family)